MIDHDINIANGTGSEPVTVDDKFAAADCTSQDDLSQCHSAAREPLASGEGDEPDLTIAVADSPVVRSVYLLRNLCLFNYFAFVSSVDYQSQTIVYQTLVTADVTFVVILASSIPVSRIIMWVWWGMIDRAMRTNYPTNPDDESPSEARRHFAVRLAFMGLNLLTVYGLVFSITLYMIYAGMLGSNILIMFDVRGRGCRRCLCCSMVFCS